MPPKKWVPFHDPSKRWCICQVPLCCRNFWGPLSWTSIWTSPHADLAWSTMMSTSKHPRYPPRPISHFVSKDIRRNGNVPKERQKIGMFWPEIGHESQVLGGSGIIHGSFPCPNILSAKDTNLWNLVWGGPLKPQASNHPFGPNTAPVVNSNREVFLFPSFDRQPISSKKDPKGRGWRSQLRPGPKCSEITWTSFCRWSHQNPTCPRSQIVSVAFLSNRI